MNPDHGVDHSAGPASTSGSMKLLVLASALAVPLNLGCSVQPEERRAAGSDRGPANGHVVVI